MATVSNASTNIFGYVGYTGTTAQVIFRGTQESSLINWIESMPLVIWSFYFSSFLPSYLYVSDLNYSHSTPYPAVPNAFVHSGFLDAWHCMSPSFSLSFHSYSFFFPSSLSFFPCSHSFTSIFILPSSCQEPGRSSSKSFTRPYYSYTILLLWTFLGCCSLRYSTHPKKKLKQNIEREEIQY